MITLLINILLAYSSTRLYYTKHYRPNSSKTLSRISWLIYWLVQ